MQRRGRVSVWLVLLAALLIGAFLPAPPSGPARTAAAANPPRRVVVFVPGLATELRATGTPDPLPYTPVVHRLVDRCDDPDEDPLFGHLKAQLLANEDYGFPSDCSSFLNYSYDGNGFWDVKGGRFYPPSYSTTDTGQSIKDQSVPILGGWLGDYEQRTSGEQLDFVLVGHSLGGVIALDYARKVADARAAGNGDKFPNVVAVMTIDSPLWGVSPRDRDAAATHFAFDRHVPKQKFVDTYTDFPKLIKGSLASDELVKRWTIDWSETAATLRTQGIATYTTGNRYDCILRPWECGIPRDFKQGQWLSNWDLRTTAPPRNNTQRLPGSYGPDPLPIARAADDPCAVWPSGQTGKETITYAGLFCIKPSHEGLLGSQAGNWVPALASWINLAGRPPTLHFTVQPVGNLPGTPFSTQPKVTIKDSFGAVATNFTGPITLRIKNGTGTSGATLEGTKTMNAANGVAAFSGLSIDKPGTGYVLTASAEGADSADSDAFAVQRPRLVFTTQPGGGPADSPFVTQPVVTAKDASNKTVTSFDGAVTLAIKDSTGDPDATLAGTKTMQAVDGVATFSGLSIDEVGSGYVLTANAPDATATESTSFAISGPAQGSQRIERVNVAADGSQAAPQFEFSLLPALSSDGRYVAFDSASTNLVPGDTNGFHDIFVKDRQTGAIERASSAADGSQANSHSSWPSLSSDGRYVAFLSFATNLVPGDTNGFPDIFVTDRQTGAIERVSVAADGSQANGDSRHPMLSGNGRYVVFENNATNLVPGDTDGARNIFVKDRQTGAIERLSFGARPLLSNDGRYVVFHSVATGLVPGDTNGQLDVFVTDRQTGAIERVSVAADGSQQDRGGSAQLEGPGLSGDGRYVAFSSNATNLVPGDTNGRVDIFVKDRQTGAIERANLTADGSQTNGFGNSLAALSRDGRYVVFESSATDLVPSDTNGIPDIFVKDRQTGAIERVSVAADGSQANGGLWILFDRRAAALSSDGRYVAFNSAATNLVPGDTNEALDVFVVDRTVPIQP